MKLDEIKMVARERGVVPGRMRKAELVRAIQSEEGNPQCYNTHFSTQCGQEECLWREDCS